MRSPSNNPIGRLNEYTIHSQLKDLFTIEGSVCEARVDTYIVDVVNDEQLIEIQTRNFFNIKRKLERLLENHKVLLVAPLPAVTHIIVMDKTNTSPLYRRKSPKKNRLAGIAPELCRIVSILKHPNFTLKVLLTEEEDIRINDGQGSWRRKGISLTDRKLLAVLEEHKFNHKSDYLCLLPPSLPKEFTNKDIAEGLTVPPRVAQGVSYCLKALNLIKVSRKAGNRQFFQLA